MHRQLTEQMVVDEAQNVPAIFDAVQHLYDSDKRHQYLGSRKIHYLRTEAGAEVDFILRAQAGLLPSK